MDMASNHITGEALKQFGKFFLMNLINELVYLLFASYIADSFLGQLTRLNISKLRQ